MLPTLIQWEDARHPADAMTDAGVRIAALAAAHPEPGSMRAALAALGLSETLKVTFDAAQGSPRCCRRARHVTL